MALSLFAQNGNPTKVRAIDRQCLIQLFRNLYGLEVGTACYTELEKYISKLLTSKKDI